MCCKNASSLASEVSHAAHAGDHTLDVHKIQDAYYASFAVQSVAVPIASCVPENPLMLYALLLHTNNMIDVLSGRNATSFCCMQIQASGASKTWCQDLELQQQRLQFMWQHGRGGVQLPGWLPNAQ
jgi:hypothetical protein